MRNLRSIFVIACSWLSLMACEQEIKINGTTDQPQLWVYGFVGPDSLASLILTETQGFDRWLEQGNLNLFPKDLEPVIETDFETIPLIGQPFVDEIYRYQATKIIKDSGVYHLKLLHNDDSLSAKVKLPPKPNLTDLRYEFNWLPNVLSAYDPRNIDFYFPKLVGGEESYQLEYGYAGWIETSVYDSISQDYVLDTIYAAYSILSEWVQNTPQTNSLKIPAYYYISILPEVELLADGSERRYIPIWMVLTAYSPFVKEYFDKLPIRSNGYGNDPFVEPKLIPSNIENGLGIFAAYHPSDTVWMKIYLD